MTVQFSSASYSVNEGGGSATITMTLSEAATQQVTLGYYTSGGTATGGTDYTAAMGALTFQPNETTKTFRVAITDDLTAELDESVGLMLTVPTNAMLGSPAMAQLTIVDDEPPPTVQFSAASNSVVEGGGAATIRVTLSGPSSRTVTVSLSTQDGTATSTPPGQDYHPAPPGSTVTFAPGEVSKSFDLQIVDDTIYEPDETVMLTLSNPTNAVLGLSSAVLTIMDDDSLQRLTLVSAREAICAGGKNDSLHRTELTATLTDLQGVPQQGVITFQTTAGTLDTTSVSTDSMGRATVTLSSDDRASDPGADPPFEFKAKVTATGQGTNTAGTEIEFQPPACTLTTGEEGVDGTDYRFALTWDDQPVSAHEVSWVVDRIWNEAGNLVYCQGTVSR